MKPSDSEISLHVHEVAILRGKGVEVHYLVALGAYMVVLPVKVDRAGHTGGVSAARQRIEQPRKRAIALAPHGVVDRAGPEECDGIGDLRMRVGAVVKEVGNRVGNVIAPDDYLDVGIDSPGQRPDVPGMGGEITEQDRYTDEVRADL